MATLSIVEYERAALDMYGRPLPVPVEPPLASQDLAIGGTSAQCVAFNARTRFVRIATDTACSVLFGTDPTAVAASGRLPAGMVEFRGLPAHDEPGRPTKLAVIAT